MARLGLRGRMTEPEAWALLGLLLGILAINLARAGLGPVAVPAADGGAERDPGPPRACRGRGVGRGDRPSRVLPGRAGRGADWRLAAEAPARLAGVGRGARWCWWCRSLCCCPPPFSSLACATPPPRGFTPTTPPTRSRSPGDLLLDGDNPYGHDYRESGMERFYTRDGSVSERVREREVSLEHYAYFPGTVDHLGGVAPAAVPVRRLPAARAAVHAGWVRGRTGVPGAALAGDSLSGAVVVANPIAVRSAWFGQNDAPSLTLMLLAFALVTRERYRWAAASLAARGAAQAVRGGGDPLHRADAAVARRPALRAQARGAPSSAGWWRRESCRS